MVWTCLKYFLSHGSLQGDIHQSFVLHFCVARSIRLQPKRCNLVAKLLIDFDSFLDVVLHKFVQERLFHHGCWRPVLVKASGKNNCTKLLLWHSCLAANTQARAKFHAFGIVVSTMVWKYRIPDPLTTQLAWLQNIL